MQEEFYFLFLQGELQLCLPKKIGFLFTTKQVRVWWSVVNFPLRFFFNSLIGDMARTNYVLSNFSLPSPLIIIEVTVTVVSLSFLLVVFTISWFTLKLLAASDRPSPYDEYDCVDI